MTPELFQKINFLPDKANGNIRKAATYLGVIDDLHYVDIIPENEAIYGDCFPNVLRKINQVSGEIVYGWRFYEYTYMIEAEFHAIWKSPEGKLVDITPFPEATSSKILFGIDRNKNFDGTRTDNYRLNTTNNELVDDIIEIEKAKFNFIDSIEMVDKNGSVIMTTKEQMYWKRLEYLSYEVDKLFAFNGTINSPCHCGSSKSYAHCHRGIVRQTIKST